MVINGQKDKERMICLSVSRYMEQGLKKSVAVRRTMSDFNYMAEASIYGVLRRNNFGKEVKNDK